MSHWYNKRSRLYWYDQYARNDQQTAFAAYDPERIVDELVQTGADIVALYACNQFGIAYYPSNIWPQHPGLKGRDYLGELISGLRSHGKKIIAYINWLDSKHPEWNVVPPGIDASERRSEIELVDWADPSNPNRRVQALAGGAWQCPCANSPKREQVVEIAREIVERYKPDAFHLDMFHYLEMCTCDYCRPHLERICGTEDISLEKIEEHWADYIDWRYQNHASLIADVTSVVREHGAMAAHNASIPLIDAVGGFSEEWLPHLDVFLSEAFDAFRTPNTDLNISSITAKLHHGLGVPSWMLRTSTPSHYAHWPITKAQWEIYAAACKANGCAAFGPCGIGARPDTTSAKRLLENVKHGFDFYMKDADLSDGAVSDSKVALVFSWATRKYQGNHNRWQEEFVGWGRLLIEKHIPYDAVVAERVTTAKDLEKYDLVILPNVSNVSVAFCSAVREYVRNGGRVIATAETSLKSDRGLSHEDFALSDVLGVSSRGSFEGHFAVERPTEPEPVSGVLQLVKATGTVVARRVSVDPAGSVSRSKDPLPMGLTACPILVANDFGDGKSLYAACDVGRYYALHGDYHTGVWMAEMIDSIIPERQIEVKAPRTLEVTVWRQEDEARSIIHLCNRTVPWTLPTDERQISEIIPLHDVEISLKMPSARPTVACRGSRVTSRVEGDRLTITLDRLDAYAAVLVSGG